MEGEKGKQAMTHMINKTMDREDLFTEAAGPTVADINSLVREIYGKKQGLGRKKR